MNLDKLLDALRDLIKEDKDNVPEEKVTAIKEMVVKNTKHIIHDIYHLMDKNDMDNIYITNLLAEIIILVILNMIKESRGIGAFGVVCACFGKEFFTLVESHIENELKKLENKK